MMHLSAIKINHFQHVYFLTLKNTLYKRFSVTYRLLAYPLRWDAAVSPYLCSANPSRHHLDSTSRTCPQLHGQGEQGSIAHDVSFSAAQLQKKNRAIPQHVQAIFQTYYRHRRTAAASDSRHPTLRLHRQTVAPSPLHRHVRSVLHQFRHHYRMAHCLQLPTSLQENTS